MGGNGGNDDGSSSSSIDNSNRSRTAVPPVYTSDLLDPNGGVGSDGDGDGSLQTAAMTTNHSQHPIDIADANAEAARLAIALGVASSVRQPDPQTLQEQQQHTNKKTQKFIGSLLSRQGLNKSKDNNNNNNNSNNPSQLDGSVSSTNNDIIGIHINSNNSNILHNNGSNSNSNSNSNNNNNNNNNAGSILGSMGSSSFHRMGSNGSGHSSVLSSNNGTTTTSQIGLNLGTHGQPNLLSPAVVHERRRSQHSTYVPPTAAVAAVAAVAAAAAADDEDNKGINHFDLNNLVIKTSMDDHDPPHWYDMHGQRAPYREGAYEFFHAQDGRQMRRRWYGRLEDGYLAWSSIYLHEYFGFTIYTPLTLEEQEEMKKPNGKIPKWMNETSSLPNLAIFLSYFCIGVALQLLRTPLIVYFIEDLNASAAEVNVLFTVMAVPWCFKVIYGFLSDCLPISGLRRKPYFMTGWLIYILSNLILMVYPIPSIQVCILLVFTQTAGYMLADVMTDALIVERSRYESQESRGTLQSKGYIIRFFGSTIGAMIGAVVYNKDGWDWYLPIRLVFFINAAFPMIFLVPLVPYLLELETDCEPKNFYLQCKDLFNTAQLRAVWQPMTFVYIYNALQLTNAAWMNFLVEGLDFSAWQIGLVSIVGSIMAWFGIMTYKKFFFASNWRIVYFWCTTLASLIALGQLILVFGINRNVGINDIWFSMGDDVLVEFVIAVQFLPMCIMYLGLCPPGSEGTTYAMLTTWSNLAGSLAFDISTALTVVWDVSSETIAKGEYGGVWKLSLLCGLIGPVPLLLLGLIPKNKEDQRRLQRDTSRHYWAGVAFISVMILTLVITFIESVYEVYFNDESLGYENERRTLAKISTFSRSAARVFSRLRPALTTGEL